ncbi:chromosome partitioning protein ParA [Aureimonas endophytica]|uniref:non-specific protein-tyrosine kinase n=1 Tax=Aureimonas endophytica TaxID=2027858 RepID=A0A916ZKG1_9HYPH|nr:polysaccharide biosynthesis tyrosine autokinase [Aureimonas endophytica]GGE01004.1 chromosome partitioning protein ParA [Aureimonas endophytica]
MLQDARSVASRSSQEAEIAGPASPEFIDFDRLLAAVRRQWRLVAVLGLIGLLLGIAYVMTAVPRYTASSNLLIDQGSNRIVDELSTSGGSIEDESGILSQVELLKSDQIGNKVIDALHLTSDESFMHSSVSLLRRVKLAVVSVVDISSWFRAPEEEADDEAEKRLTALALLGNDLDVARVGRSYVLSISYTSPDPVMAARVAQAFANAYLADQLDSKYEATRRASSWLQQRIDELRQKSLETDLAVQRFRAEKGLIAADGRLVSDQQLTELNSQLTLAQADVATARAKMDRIQSLLESGDTNSVVNDALASTVINELRTKYLDAAKRQAEISNRLGNDHAQAVRLRAEMENYKQLMFSELGRIAESYRSDLQVAQAREAAVQRSVADATSVSAGANETQVQLRELEREAETYRNLYQTFLQRYQEAVQQQSFPITEARVITDAQVPTAPSKPRKPLVLAISLFIGLAAGSALGAFREFRDRFFRTGDQVREELGLAYLGSVPHVKDKALAIPTQKAGTGTEASDRYLRANNAVARYVLDHPLSSFAETLRSAKIAADLAISHQKKIIGVISVLPSEGKSMISANLAELIASHGSSAILIDGDIRNPGLTRAVARHATAGLLEAVMDERPLKDCILVDPETKLALVPAVVKHRVPHTADLLSSVNMTTLLDEASNAFDYVVLDLPPLGPVVDVRAIAPRIDAFIFVVEWGKTARRVVRSTLAANPQIAEKTLGVILNKVDTEKMKLYRDFGSDEYYTSRYSSYYHQGK